jgi:hypothetical protein
MEAALCIYPIPRDLLRQQIHLSISDTDRAILQNISIASLHLDTSRTWMTWFSLLMRHKSDANTKPAPSAAHGLAANQHTVSPNNQLLPGGFTLLYPLLSTSCLRSACPVWTDPHFVWPTMSRHLWKGWARSLYTRAHHQWRVFTFNGARTRRTDWAWIRYWPRFESGTGQGFLFSHSLCAAGMKTDRIRTDITDIVFVFIFMSGFGFEHG